MPSRYNGSGNELLTNSQLGYAADFMRRRVGKSVVGEVREVDTRVSRLEAVTVFNNRQPQGLYIYVGGQRIDIPFDADGWLMVGSESGNVVLDNQPWERKSVLDLDALVGCPNALSEATAQNGDATVTMEGCDTLGFSGRDTGTYVRTRTYGDNTPSAKKLQDLIVATPELGTQAPDYHITIRLDDGTDGVINIRKGAESPAP